MISKPIRLLTTLAACAILITPPVRAQNLGAPGDPGQGGENGGSLGGGRHRGNRSDGPAPPARPQPAAGPVSKPDPKQRLDAGAVVCRTEADLQQHQAAVTAALEGRTEPEPAGCRPIRTMTPVTVLDRHGEAHTQVRLTGSPEQLGWTDAIIHAP